MCADVPSNHPITFVPNRVWRCYEGGFLLDRFRGNENPADGFFPEEWLASTTEALNRENSQGPEEGLSRVRLPDGTPGPLFTDVIAGSPKDYLGSNAPVNGGGISILCKLLDSAIRLPIQCHPDRAFARAYYRSKHGKAESWTVLDVRSIGGEEPYLLMGFKPGVTRTVFQGAVDEQDIPQMMDMFHKIPARAGDVYFIPGRFPHAIGPGVSMIEIQEPSDWVVAPERYCGTVALSERDMWGPLTPDLGLECFDYQGQSEDQTLDRIRMAAKVLHRDEGGRAEQLIGPETTDCFGVERIQMQGSYTYKCSKPYHIAVVTEGSGEMRIDDFRQDIRPGDVFFAPHGISSIGYSTRSPTLSICVALPGEK